MKKLILAVMLLLGFTCSFADEVMDGKLNTVKELVYKQDILAGAIDNYINLYGVVPTIATLQSTNLLGLNFTYSGTMSVNGITKEISLTDTIASPEVYQTDLYVSTADKSKYSIHSVSGSNFTAIYPFSQKATMSYVMKGLGFSTQPTAPALVNGTYWHNTLTKHSYIYQGGWISLNAKRLFIVNSVGQLPTTHVVNDGAIVLTTTSLTKYISNGTNWYIIPQAIPFNYNGAF